MAYKSVLKLLYGSVGSQIIVLLALPLLARLYNPEQLGIYSLYMSASYIMAVIFTLSYSQAILITKNTSEEVGLFSLSVLISLLIFVIMLVPAFYLDCKVYPEGMSLVYLIIISVTFAISVGLEMMMVTSGFLYLLSVALLFATIIREGLKIIASPYGDFILIGSILIFTLIKITILSFILVKRIKNYDNLNFSFILELAKKYKDYPKYRMPQKLLSTGAMHGYPLLIAPFYPMAAVGHYAVANSIMAMGVGVIGSAILNVHTNRYQILSTANYASVLRDSILYMILALFISIFTFFSVETLVYHLLGSEWLYTGTILKYLSIYFFVVVTSRPLMAFLATRHKESLMLWFEIVVNICRALSLVFVIWKDMDIIDFVIFSSVIYFMLFFAFSFYCRKVNYAY